ncbi:MAG TPA: hypothetical protein VMP89_08805, partial [Solirubrobacteraceae bacterium]|nr:hypothetical protein [Solirubrobacteraceae bacterium]
EDLTEFVASLCRLRHASPALERRRFFREGEIEWLRPDGEPMTGADWADPEARAVAVTAPDGTFVLLVNGWWEPLEFTLPEPLRTARFSVAVDTSEEQPRAAIGPADMIRLEARSLVLLAQTPEEVDEARHRG